MPLDNKAITLPSVCPHDCPSVCALDVERLPDGKIGKVRGAKSNSYTAGVVCAKVARYSERVHHPERLLKPLRRVGKKGVGISEFEEISWDEALDAVADGLIKAEQKLGPETVWPYFYAGTMGWVQRDGIERLRHAKKYSRQYSTICITLADAGWNAGVGEKRGLDPREMASSNLIVMWGGNPVSTQVNVMTHIAKARKERGAKLVVVDPYRTGTAEAADMHLQLRPGTDGALAAAVGHVLLRDQHCDRAYLARFTDWDDEIEDHYKTCTPAWASEITGLSVEEIESFAKLYGQTKRSFLRLGYGFTRSRNGAANMQAAACLPAITGAWQYEGGGALYSNSGMYNSVDKTLIMGLDNLDTSVRVLDQSRIGPILTGDKRDLGDGPPVTALFIQNTNPVVVCPESNKVREGFLRDDIFIAVHEQFMTDTAAMADIILPATTSMEHDDIYGSGGHTHFHVTRKVIDPIGDCRSNHEVNSALAKRLGIEHEGFDMDAWTVIEETFKRNGLKDANQVLEDRWIDFALPFEEAHFLKGFPQPEGRFRFKPDWPSMGPLGDKMPKLPGYFDYYDQKSEKHPFRLVTAPARQFLNTSFTETASSLKKEGRPQAKVHPDQASELGISAGDMVILGNDQGQVRLHAELFSGLQKDTIVVESIWPNAAFNDGMGINALTSAEVAPPNGGAVFHDTAVWLKKSN